MGVTTALGGPDGSSPINFKVYLDSLSKIQPGVNVAYLIGHNSVRSEVMHLDGKEPAEKELEKMKDLINRAM